MEHNYASQRPHTVGVTGIHGDAPSRRFKKPHGSAKITKDLLGAGDDPLAKD